MMKFIILTVLFAIFSLSFGSSLQEIQNKTNSKGVFTLKDLRFFQDLKGGRVTRANANEYFDELFIKLNQYIADKKYDPLKLPDVGTDFKWLFFTGELSFKNGWANGINTLKRSGNTVITYENEVITIKVPFMFSSLLCNYKYTAQFMPFGPKGGMECKFEDIKLKTYLAFDLKKFRMELKDFAITNTGTLSIKWTGNILVDWVANIFTNVTLKFMNVFIINVLSVFVKFVLKFMVGKLNQDIQNIIDGLS